MDKKEVYLVEDSADYRFLVRNVFNKFLPNYHLRFFQGAQELYQFLILQSAPEYKGRRPGVIILDLKLPAIDGYELLKLIRQTPDNEITQWKTVPVVILTAGCQDRDIEKCYKAGANSFMIKPIDIEELRHLLETICHYWIDYNQMPVAKQSQTLRTEEATE
ncbi:response regulator [Dyadobacter arcticus]|uniref:Two-component system response regulator n=1 Tax=Dyadobacter arcticus TaxID=1078754 RepID=A0ABX0UTQ4_9BACT|nr:response regulator [Dyadobacter arcticus]NIJ54321.1 two-component system response regulator [Dyadobacter arcticus]